MAVENSTADACPLLELVPGVATRTWKQYQPRAKRSMSCGHCGVLFFGNANKRFCSTKCRDRSRPSEKKRIKSVAQCTDRRAKSKYAFACEHCGTPAYRHQNGTAASKGYANRWCSQKCRKASLAVARQQRAEAKEPKEPKPKYSPINRHPCEVCGVLLWRNTQTCSKQCLYKLQSKRAQRARAVSKSCLGCSIQFCWIWPYRGKFCSDECRDRTTSVAKRVSKRTYNHMYGKSWRKKARIRGVPYELVNRIKVFNRDGWRCQICRKPTPRELLGSGKPREPTLDHRIPITKDGPHTYANTQCACRGCNTWKNNKYTLGQLPLYNQ